MDFKKQPSYVASDQEPKAPPPAGLTCVDCGKELIEKTSNSAKNPGRTYYSCPDYKGCGAGWHCWTDEPYGGKFKFGGGGGGGKKRARAPTSAPVEDKRLKTLEDEVRELRALIAQLQEEFTRIATEMANRFN